VICHWKTQSAQKMITEFTELVGLICHFRQEKGDREALDHQNFIEWLEYHRHEDIKNLIVNTAALQTEVDSLLRSDHAQMQRKLDDVLMRLDDFKQLALALVGASNMLETRSRIGPSENAMTLLKEASKSSDGFVSRLESCSYGEVLNIHTSNQDFLGKPEDRRMQAKWLHAFDELLKVGCIEPTSHPGTFRITHTGYQLADSFTPKAERTSEGQP